MFRSFTIVVADDHPLIRAGVNASLRQAVNYEVVAETRRPDETLDRLTEFQPQLLILDILMCQGQPVEWLDQYQRACPGLKILVLSSLEACGELPWLNHPAVAGFVHKSEASGDLLQAVQVVALGGTWISCAIAAGRSSRLVHS